MAYVLYHTLAFQNRITGDVYIEMYKKDGDPDFEATELQCLYAERQVQRGDGERFDTILASELNFGFFLNINSLYTYDDFLVSFHDEWQVRLYNEGNVEFVGFVTPGEGSAQFRDLPYEIHLTATDGLGFLKTDQLSKVDLSEFTGTHTLMEYLSGILAKTRLQLNIRTYCNIYESSMPDRNTNEQADMFNLAKQDFRTYQNDDGTTMDCYTALSRMLKEGFHIAQWLGKWVIVRIGELQESTGPKIWFTEYDYTGTIVDAQLEGFESGIVAKYQVLHPRNADQDISTMFAIKYAKSVYNFTPWPELPLNNKFERGTIFEDGDAPDTNDIDNDGDISEIIGTYKKFTIDNWRYGITNISSVGTYPPTGMLSPGVDLAYRYSIYNIFNVEISREIVLERNGEIPGHRYLVCDPIPVTQNSKLRLSVDYRTTAGGTGNRQWILIALVSDTGTQYRLNNAGGSAPVDGVGQLIWQQSFANVFLAKNYASGEDASQYFNFNFTTPSFPVSGKLHVCLCMFDPPVGRRIYYRALEIEYIPYVASGLVSVKGDYWLTEQSKDYKDNASEEVFISDSPEKIFKGALLQNDGITPTGRTWHRLNINENREFKEIINLARYNAAYRRMKRITGTFGGTTCRPMNALTEVEPLSFHRHYKFTDDPVLANKHFVLVPPLVIDYSKGLIKATFVEAMDTTTNDGNNEGDLHQYKFIF